MDVPHIPSERLLRLAPRAASLGYLAADDGYWADLVISQCDFLEADGYSVESVSFHQNGDSVLFRGSHGSIVFQFLPDGDYIGAEASLSGGFLSFEGQLDVLARLQQPHVVLPPKLPIDRQTIDRNVRFWAGVLRSADMWL